MELQRFCCEFYAAENLQYSSNPNSEGCCSGGGAENFPSTFLWRLAGIGDFDLCGFEKPQAAYHRVILVHQNLYFQLQSVYTDKVLGRYAWAECGNHWTWSAKQGSPVIVEVYSRPDEVELLLNSRSLGRQVAGKTNHYRARFELEFEPGELCAISYDRNGEVSRNTVVTVGDPVGLQITVECSKLTFDGQSLAYGTVKIVDAAGNYVPTAPSVLATAWVSGTATLEAFGNSRGATKENYITGSFTSFEGRWQFILRAGYKVGETHITIETETLGCAKATVLIS